MVESSWYARLSWAGAAICATVFFMHGQGHADGALAVGAGAPGAAVRPISRELSNADRLVDRVSEQGQRARGFYLNAPLQRRLGAQGIIRLLRSAGMDTAVLDFKDNEGRVTWDTKIPSFQPQKRDYIPDRAAFIRELKEAGIYTIARVVCFNDPYLPRNEPDRAVLDDRPGKKGQVWANWGRRNPWLDPYNKRNHDLFVEAAKEIEATGVDEIQLDYIRFPVDPSTSFARFPAEVPTLRRFVLLDMLARIDAAIHIPLGTDVFGLTTFRPGDPDGLGQSLEEWSAHVDVFTPMMYMKGMRSYVPQSGRDHRAGKLIYGGIKNLRRRIGNGPVIRPFLQAFESGSDYFNPDFIAEQIRATRDAGGDGFLFWDPNSNYHMVKLGVAGPARGLMPFPMDERIAWRAQHWGEPALSEAAETAR